MAVGYRRSVGERRQQLKWLASGAAVSMAGGVLTIMTSGTTGFLSLAGELGVAALAALPVSMGVAILRYRMYEIDRIISRTLSYAIVTGLLVGVYAGLVLLATGVLRFHSTVAASAGRLKDAVDLDAVRDDLIGVVSQALEPAHVSLWLSGRG